MSTCCGVCEKWIGCTVIGSLMVVASGGMVVQSAVNMGTTGLDHVTEKGKRLYVLVLTLEIICLILSALGIILGSIFVYAVLKDRPKFMAPFVFWFIITLIFAIMDTFYLSNHFAITTSSYAFLVPMAIPVGSYFTWVAWSHMLERRTQLLEEAPFLQATCIIREGKERRKNWLQ